MGATQTKPGYRIVDIMKDSPADNKGLVIYLDFIISFNGTDILSSSLPFQELVKSNIDCPVTLEILSIKDLSTRQVQITPKQWQGEGLLGMSLRYEDAFEAYRNIVHITKVFPNSTASQAGLLEDDFIIGSPDTKIKDINSILSVLTDKKQITLALFNKLDQSVHTLTLNSTNPTIGIEVANGVFHRLNSH